MKDNWIEYKNGNYTVALNLSDGTKIRETEEDQFVADFPESMDIKITNRCNMGCPMCHENSTCDGKHGDILNTKFIEQLHPYTELALGGGNVLEHPYLLEFLEKLKTLKMIPNITLNQTHFMENLDLVKYMVENTLIYGLGVSLNEVTKEFIEAVSKFPNAVIHVINGIVTMEELEKLKGHNLKILVLGYKEVRRGDALYKNENSRNAIDHNKLMFFKQIGTILKENWFDVVSFDNLAINQLAMKRFMTDEEWDEFYMGDDGIDGEMTSASMYVDLVEKEFAKNSCDTNNRYPISNLTAEQMYQFLRNKT